MLGVPAHTHTHDVIIGKWRSGPDADATGDQ